MQAGRVLNEVAFFQTTKLSDLEQFWGTLMIAKWVAGMHGDSLHVGSTNILNPGRESTFYQRMRQMRALFAPLYIAIPMQIEVGSY